MGDINPLLFNPVSSTSCEVEYFGHQYTNVVSSFIFNFHAILGLFYCNTQNIAIKIIYAMMFFAGIASAYWHYANVWISSISDTLGQSLAVAVFLSGVLYVYFNSINSQFWFSISLIALWTLTLTAELGALSAFAFIFSAEFLSAVAGVLMLWVIIQRRSNPRVFKRGLVSDEEFLSSLVTRCTILAFLGFICFINPLIICPFVSWVKYLSLHSWWHIFISFAAFYMSQILAYLLAEGKARWRNDGWFWYLNPVIV